MTRPDLEVMAEHFDMSVQHIERDELSDDWAKQLRKKAKEIPQHLDRERIDPSASQRLLPRWRFTLKRAARGVADDISTIGKHSPV